MSNANAAAPAATAAIGSVLFVCNDAGTIKLVSASVQQLAMFPEVYVEAGEALSVLNRRKYEAVIVDLQIGDQAKTILEKVRHSPSNRTAVIFAISGSDEETAGAFKEGSNFVMRRPLSPASVERSLKVAYGMIVRERRRYFRCPVEISAAIKSADMPVVHGRTLNISEGGMAINTSLSLKPGLPVRLQFALPDHANQFEVEATVCWSKEGYLGFQFTSLSAQLTSELQEWLARQLEETFPESVADKFRTVEPGEQPSQSVREAGRGSTEAGSQSWVIAFRAAVAEKDPAKRLLKIESAELSMKQRWSGLAVTGMDAAEERRELIEAFRQLGRLKAT